MAYACAPRAIRLRLRVSLVWPCAVGARSAGRSKPPPNKSPAGADDPDGFTAAGKKKGRSKKADPSMLGFSVESTRIMQGEIQFVDGM